ncbi:hypothetical protein LINPERPRIM_LOCUS2749 [Linum perenne]
MGSNPTSDINSFCLS